MKIQSFGAAREVTGSRHLIEVNGKKIFLDFGMFQGHRKECDVKNRNFPFDASKIDAVILSHAHIDHSGGLPLLVKNGFRGPIYATFATRDLCNFMLMDSAYIQEKDAEYMKEKIAKKKTKKEPMEPLYGVEDAQRCLLQFHGVNYQQSFEVTDGVKCTLFDAGHILGSSLIYLEIDERESGKHFTFAFTGDLGRKNLPILRDPQILPPTDYLMIESTYGNRFHENIQDVANKLEEVIKRTVKRGGKIIIPAFSLERTQEIVYHLNLLWQAKRIPDMEIFVDSPLSANLTEVFKAHPECFDAETQKEFINNSKNPFGFGKLTYTHSVEESKALNAYNAPCIIISASGMCENGRILHHLRNNIEDPKNTIMMVGFMAKDTLGRKIMDKMPVVNIYGETHHLRAEVVVMDAFSGHADRSDLLDYISNVKGLKKLFLVHGEGEQQEIFKGYLAESGFKDVTLNEPGVTYEI